MEKQKILEKLKIKKMRGQKKKRKKRR